jgi:hypothetical protein
MYKHALINKETNVVENTIIWTGGPEWTLPDTHTAIRIDDQLVGIGHIHNGDGIFIAPELVKPPEISTPTLEQLQSQLATITTQMQALANTANT